MIPALEPFLLGDPDVKPFQWDYRIDLAAPDAQLETINEGVFVVLREKIPKGQIALIGAVVPYMMERTDIGTPTESVRLLPTGTYDGLVSFNPLFGTLTPYVNKVNYNAPATLLTAQNLQRTSVNSGNTHPQAQVGINAQNWNPLYRIPVPSETEFVITFQIIPQASTGIATPLPVYPIRSEQGVDGSARIDWVGVVVTGVLMAQTKFDQAVQKATAKGF